MSDTKLKEGQIVENYQGKFAKVVSVGDDGRVGLTVWRQKKEHAEEETMPDRYLNSFGLSQVLKGGANVPGAEKTAPEKTAEKPKKEAAKKTAEKQD